MRFFFSITKLKNDLIVRLIIKKKRKKKITSVDFLNYLSDRACAVNYRLLEFCGNRVDPRG